MLTSGHQAGTLAYVTQGLDINQVIAYNLMRVRKALGLSQEQAAERLEPHLGVRWSKAVYSAAERSYGGKRVRQFTAADVAAFAVAFQVPLLYFFLPPKPEDREAGGVMIGDRLVAWPDLLDLMLDGKQQSALQLRLIELPANEWPKNRSQLPALGIGAWREFPHLEDSPQVSMWESSPPSDEGRAKPPIVAAIVTSDRGVLVGRRNDGKPPWTFIAGEQDAVQDESPRDTAIRETKEETGLRIVAGDEIGRRVHPVTNRLMVYVAAKPALRASLDVIAEDTDELAEVRWVSLAEADELLPGLFEPVRDHLARELGEAER